MSDEQPKASGYDYDDEVEFKQVQTSTFPKYQGVEGCTDRIAVLSPKLMRSYSYYVEDANTRFRVDKQPSKWLTQRLGQPEQKFALIFFKYATDQDGTILTEDKLAGKVCIWVFSEKKFDQIKGRFQRYPLMNTGPDAEQVDLLIACEDSQWQKLDFDVTDGAHWRKKPEWVEALNAKVEDAKKRADFFLGGRKSEDEIKQLLGITKGGGPAAASDADVELGDVLAD